MMRQLIMFSVLMLTIVVLTSLLHMGAIRIARTATYDKMETNAEHTLGAIDSELNSIRKGQINFFYDRQIVYLSDGLINISPYEKRNILLAAREDLNILVAVSTLPGEVVLYLPRSNYVVTPSSIVTMTEELRESLELYEGVMKGGLIERENDFIMLENGSTKMKISTDDSYLFVITIPKRNLLARMNSIDITEDDGAFFYSEQYGVVANEEQKKLAEDIYAKLQKDENGEYLTTQSLRVGGERYLVFVEKSDILGNYIQFIKEEPVVCDINSFWYGMFFAWCVIAILALWFIRYTRRSIHQPIDHLLEAFDEMKAGNFTHHFYDDGGNEFSYLYGGYNEMLDQMNHLVNEVLIQKNLIQEVELKQLQAQINPHFLYNSFFILSRRIKRHDEEGAEQFANLLGNYFKFLTRSGQDFIELRREVEHARCYAKLQGTRFVGRINVEFEILPEKYEKVRVPRLILQPLLENSFEHGLEDKESDGIMQVRFETLEDKLFIHVEDNGNEATDDVIRKMQESLEEGISEEITGIINIHKRLQIYFKNQAGLKVSRSTLGGACVTIWMILREEGEENESFIDCR